MPARDLLHRAAIAATLCLVAGSLAAAHASNRPEASGAVWIADGDQAYANLGTVTNAGDVNADGYDDVVVAAPGYDGLQFDGGRVYLYIGSAEGLASTSAWTADGDRVSDWHGLSLSTAGDVDGDGYSDVVIGARLRVYVYRGSPTGLTASPAWIADGTGAFGHSVSTAGDVNGDGYSDVILGDYNGKTDQYSEGQAFVYMGSPSGLSPEPAWIAEGDQESAFFGLSVASAGDVNGDGYSDVLVGAPGYDGALPDVGRAYLYLGSASGLSGTPAWSAESEQSGSNFGTVASAGDVNGDGYSDVIVGASGFNSGVYDDAGKVYLYLGSASGLSGTPAWSAEGDQELGVFGAALSAAGDVDGNGYGDIIVGALGYHNGGTYAGRVCVYLGSSSGLSKTPRWVADGDRPWGLLGNSVATAGDVDADGYSDILLGAKLYTRADGPPEAGRVYAYRGPLAPVPGTLGGSVTGLVMQRVSCRNKTTGDNLGVPVSDSAWNCEALGLVVNVGNHVQTSAKGTVSAGGGPVGGSVVRMRPNQVFCENVTTGANVEIESRATSWDCEAMGIVLSPGDTIVTGATGKAE